MVTPHRIAEYGPLVSGSASGAVYLASESGRLLGIGPAVLSRRFPRVRRVSIRHDGDRLAGHVVDGLRPT